MFFRRIICALALIILQVTGAPVYAQSDVDERSEMIRTQNALKLFREFESDSRHLFFIKATAIIAFEGGWIEREPAQGSSYAENLREIAASALQPRINRLSARLGGNKNLSEDEKARMLDSVEKMNAIFALSDEIAEALDAKNGALANSLYQEGSLPLFKAIWATNYTLISSAEKRFPRR